MNRKLFFVLLILLLAVFGGGRFLGKKAAVKTAAVKRQDLEVYVEVSGKTQALWEANLAFLILGQLEMIASPGAGFKKGATLARLKTADLWAGYQQAQAILNKAQAIYENAEAVKKENDLTYAWRHDDISKAKVEQVDANTQAAAESVNAARFAVDAAGAALEKAYLKAPFAGTVGQVSLRVGETVNPGQVVLSLLDPRFFYFEVEVDEVEVGGLKVGQTAAVTLDAFPAVIWPAIIEGIDLSAHTTGSGGTAYSVRLTFEAGGQPSFGRSGLNGEARLLKERKENVLTVPASAITTRESKTFVQKVENGKSINVEVRLGEFVDGRYEVLEGLIEGDLLIAP